MQRLHINAKDDLVLRLAHCDEPVQAIIELIWNSLDAEANNVNVVVERDAMDAVERVRVEDHGHALPSTQTRSIQRINGGRVDSGGLLRLVLERAVARLLARHRFP